MKKYIAKSDPRFRSLITSEPPDDREARFSELWQQKKYSEAIETSFPDKWEWFAEDIEKETVCDHTKTCWLGEAFSERAFAIIHAEFPEETQLNHPIELDGYKFIWVSPPLIDKSEFELSTLGICLVRPVYTTFYSEEFVQLWNKHGFVGHEFIEMKEPRFFPMQ